MSQRKAPQLSTRPIYSNIRIIGPDGKFYSYCSKRRADYFITMGMGTVVCEDPLTVQFYREPKGDRYTRDEYFSQPKENRCVVCGVEELLTRHHVVPYCFMQHFPDNMKDWYYYLHDVLPLCHPCHSKYEAFAEIKKNELIETVCGGQFYQDKDLSRAIATSKTLLRNQSIKFGKMRKPRHKVTLPESVRQEMYDYLKEYFGKEEIANEDLLQWTQLKSYIKLDGYDSWGQYVVEHTKNLKEFIRSWRQHFLESMKPQFMPEFWHVDRWAS